MTFLLKAGLCLFGPLVLVAAVLGVVCGVMGGRGSEQPEMARVGTSPDEVI